MKLTNSLKIWTVTSLTLVLIIDSIGVGLVFPLLGPLFFSQSSIVSHISLALREFYYGITLAIFPVFMFFGAPFWGDLSDKIGRKTVLLICLFGTAFGLAISALGIHFGIVAIILFGRAFTGYLAGSQSLAQAAIVDISNPQEKAANLSLISLAGCIGFTCGPLLGGVFSKLFLNSTLGFELPFWSAGLLALINGCLLLLVFKETFHPVETSRTTLTKGLIIFIAAINNKIIRKLTIIYLLAESGWALYFSALPIRLMTTFGYSTRQISYLLSFMGFLFALVFLFLTKPIAQYLKSKTIAYTSMLLTAISILLILVNSQLVIWLSLIPACIGGGLFYVALLTMFSDTVGADKQGWVMGVFGAAIAISWFVGGMLSGILSGLALFLPFTIAALAMIIGGIMSIFLSNAQSLV